MKKFFLAVVVGVIAIMMFSLNSYAADGWTDLSNAKIEVTQKDSGRRKLDILFKSNRNNIK